MNSNIKLSIIIPTLNEAHNLPFLLEDIKECNYKYEAKIVDSCSSDKTILNAKLAGCKITSVPKPNRGYQMHKGALESSGEWLLFLHADSRLEKGWHRDIKKIMQDEKSSNYAWFFNLKIKDKKLDFRLMETLVLIRSCLFQRPYGDQGLLINQKLYKKVGGYRPLHLMEDLDLIIRLSELTDLKSINSNIYTNSRKWEGSNIFKIAIKNHNLRQRWYKGESSFILHKEYYSQK